MTALIERDGPLRELRRLLEAAGRAGRIALVAGEAGIGKTSLLRALAAGHRGPVWWGACDALQTPHPLAPLADIARDAQPGLAPLLAGPRPALFEAVIEALRGAAAPVLVVIEDAHWADDATLDLLKYLGRRIERTRALLAVSFRDDEVSVSHPLRRVIGELPAAALGRIELERLSAEAVETLARRASRPAAGIHAATRGNPFFVAEVLREPASAVPRTVQDLVLARQARLSPAAQALLRLASVVPGQVERALVDALLQPEVAEVEACLASGLLVAEGATLAFRHELARRAVEASLSAPAAQALHARVLAALAAGAGATPTRLVHHALGAHDRAAVGRYAPLAAAHAAERGAHREAAAHWRSALESGVPAHERERLAWLEAYARECQLIGQLDAAIEARATLAQGWRGLGEPLREADNISRGALLRVHALRNAEADADSRRALALFETMPPSVEHAHACWVQAQLRMLNRECAEAIDWARRAIALAERFGDHETRIAATGTLGTATLFVDYDAGVARLREALAQALERGLHGIAANCYSNLGSGAGELFRFGEARGWLDEAIGFAAAHEIDFAVYYAKAWLALCELQAGRWDAAAAHASEVVARAGAETTSAVMAQLALGRLRLRRGDPGVEPALDAALALAEKSGTLQRVAPVRAARAEWALLLGDAARADAEAAAALPLAEQRRHPWFVGELAMWRWRAGGLAAAPAGCAEPFALEIAGRWREAAAAWQRLECPYERARALADGDAQAQREALALLKGLGARPAAQALEARLRKAGVRGLPRGARPSTRSHPCGLTEAELGVLALMAQDLRNAEIAAHLHRSVRTIDHHVAAVLAKLGVGSRLEAVRRARREGWLPQSGQSAPAE